MCGLLFLAGFLRFFSPFDPGSEVPQGHEAVRVARNLVAGHGFASPFRMYPTGPTAHIAPVYPFFQAALWRLFGTGDVGNFLFLNLEALVLALQIALLPVLARAFRMHASAGFTAAVIGLAPAVIEKAPRWEANYVAVLIMLAAWGMSVIACEKAPSVRTTALIAFLWGVLILANPSSVLPYAGWLVWLGFLLFSQRDTLTREGTRVLLILVAVPAMLILPWIVRNYVVFERFIFIRSNLGLELRVSNNPSAVFAFRANESFRAIHPEVSLAAARQLVAMGEPAYQETLLNAAIEWIQQHPRRFFALTLQRFWFFWFPTDEGNNIEELLSKGRGRGLRAFVIYSATLVSLPGLLLLFYKNPPGGLVCLLWLGCFPIVHYVVQFDSRYRSPILWLTFLLAAFAAISLVQRLVGHPGSADQLSKKDRPLDGMHSYPRVDRSSDQRSIRRIDPQYSRGRLPAAGCS